MTDEMTLKSRALGLRLWNDPEVRAFVRQRAERLRHNDAMYDGLLMILESTDERAEVAEGNYTVLQEQAGRLREALERLLFSDFDRKESGKPLVCGGLHFHPDASRDARKHDPHCPWIKAVQVLSSSPVPDEDQINTLSDELWGLLTPDMGPEEWRAAVKQLASPASKDYTPTNAVREGRYSE